MSNLLISILLASAIGTASPQVETISVNGVEFRMIKVEGGSFTMGATAEQEGHAAMCEMPAHEVVLSDYYIGEFEVTQDLWCAVMGEAKFTFEGAKVPADKRSLKAIHSFIKKLNELTGLHFALPTEAQWEYAARGGKYSQGYVWSGSNDACEVGWICDNSQGYIHEVGTRKPNELGIYDMCGNVMEWCEDWYAKYPSETQTDPKGPEKGSYTVLRGGSWCGSTRTCRNTSRSYDASGTMVNGFRLVMIP